MLKLSAFADEISADLNEQIQTCRENGITHFELRGVNNKNVMDFDAALKSESLEDCYRPRPLPRLDDGRIRVLISRFVLLTSAF